MSEWELPREWEVRPLRDLAEIDREQLSERTLSDYQFYYLDISSAWQGHLSLPSKPIQFGNAPSRARIVVHRGDVLMSTVRPNLQAFAYFDHSDQRFVASTGFAVLSPRQGVDGQYILYALLSDPLARQIDSRTTGSNYPAVSGGDVARLRLPVPPPREQRRIAEILTTVDRQIEKTEALIAKYEAIQKGMAADLLTLGIDSDGHLREKTDQGFKSSDIGIIPESWETDNLGNQLELIVGPAFDSSNFTDNTDALRLLRGVNVTQGHIRWDKSITARWPQLSPDLEPYLLYSGDVVIGMDGALVGRNYATLTENDVPSLLVQRVACLRARSGLNQRLMYYLISSARFRQYVDRVKTHTAIPHISGSDIRNFIIPLPPKEEQNRIANILDQHADLIGQERSFLRKLKQIKQGLMQDLLTGRVRVNASHLETTLADV